MTYGDGLLTVTPEGITIDTGLSAREAGTAKLSQHQTEQGVIIEVHEDRTVIYNTWSWTGSHEDIATGRKNYSVFVDGEAFDGKPLLTLMEEAEAVSADGSPASPSAREKLRATLNDLSTAVEDAAEKGVYLPDNGPFGTLVADDGRILLLPENVFIRALNSRSDREASKFAGCWKNTALQGIDSWRFTLACYAYRYLSGRNAFPQEDTQIRAADYFDKNFIPLEWYCTIKEAAIDNAGEAAVVDTAELFRIIRANLSKAAPIQEDAKQKKKKALKRSSVEQTNSMPMPELPFFTSRECENFALDGEYIKQQKKLKKTRFVRQNSLAIKWCSIGAIVLLFFVVTFIKDKLDVPTTIGMEPAEVLALFYDSFDQLDATHFDITHTDDSAETLSNFLTTMFVTSKMRQSYESMGTYTVNQWLSNKDLTNSYIFGITHYEATPCGKEPPADGKADITDEFTWKVHYYIVFNNGNDEFSYIDQSDVITISWKKDRWLVTGQETVSSIQYDEAAPTLLAEVLALQPEEYNLETQGVYLLSQLKDTYPWLPTEAEIAKGKQQLIDGWNATEYQRVLSLMDLK